MRNRIIFGTLVIVFFTTGCAGSRSYAPKIQEQLVLHTIAAKDVIRPEEHELLLNAQVVLAYHEGEFTTLAGKNMLRKLQKEQPVNWPQGVRVIRIETPSKKEAEAEEKRLRQFVQRIQGHGR